MKCILPIEESPMFKTYAYWGNYLSILQGKGYDISNLVYNSFLILPYYLLSNSFGITAGYKLRKIFNKNIFGKIPSDFLQLLKKNIIIGNYAIITLNQRNIENRNHDFWHEWLIYGFDDENENIYALGYAEECKGLSVFKARTFTYEEFLSLLPPEDSKTGASGKYYDNQFLWLAEDFEMERVNIKAIKRKLFRLNNNLIYPWENQNFYRMFYHTNSIIRKNRNKAFDLRPLKSISEHKKMRKRLFLDLCKDKSIVAEYSEIVNMSEKMLIIAAKYNLAQDYTYEKKKEYSTRINNIFINICNKERVLLKKLYSNLKEV